MPASDKKRYTSIYTDEETREHLDKLSKKHNTSRSEIVRRAVAQMAVDASKVRQKVRELVKLTGA
jgi:predicted transcriptional regulator